LKKEGNTLFSSGQGEEAAVKYTEALDLCPLEFADDRAIYFANRAAARTMTVRH